MNNHPQHPRHLPGTKWTSRVGLYASRHWEVEVVREKAGLVRLRAALFREEVIEIPWRGLRDRADWMPGWQSTAD